MEDSSVMCLLFLPGLRSQRMLICLSPFLERGTEISTWCRFKCGSSRASKMQARKIAPRGILLGTLWELVCFKAQSVFLTNMITSKTWPSDICASGSRIVNPAALSIQSLQNDSSLLPHICALLSTNKAIWRLSKTPSFWQGQNLSSDLCRKIA